MQRFSQDLEYVAPKRERPSTLQNNPDDEEERIRICPHHCSEERPWEKEGEEGKKREDVMDMCSSPRSVATINSFDERNRDFIGFS